MTRSTLSFDSAVATGRGDDGTTGLLFGGDRIRKDDLRTEAYGTVDEAVAALGMARAELGMKAQYGGLSPNLGGLGEVILRLQRELFAVGAELATNPDASRPPAGRHDARVRARWSTAWTRCCARPRPPSSCRASSSSPARPRLSAALEVARTIIRRAERRTVTLARRRRGLRRRPHPSLPEPSRRPALDPRSRGRAGGGEAVDRGPALEGSRPIERGVTREERIVTGQPLIPHRPTHVPVASSASARRRRSSSSCSSARSAGCSPACC